MRNISSADQIVRIVMSFIFALLAFQPLGGLAGTVIFAALAVVMLSTALLKFCPLYAILKIRSFKPKK